MSDGVNPMNQPSRCSLAVPVLPAAGRPTALSECAVPAGSSITERIKSAVRYAVSGLIF